MCCFCNPKQVFLQSSEGLYKGTEEAGNIRQQLVLQTHTAAPLLLLPPPTLNLAQKLASISVG